MMTRCERLGGRLRTGGLIAPAAPLLALFLASALFWPGVAHGQASFFLDNQVVGCLDARLARLAEAPPDRAVPRHGGCRVLRAGEVWEQISGGDGVLLLRRTPPQRWLPPLFVAARALGRAARRLPGDAAENGAPGAGTSPAPVGPGGRSADGTIVVTNLPPPAPTLPALAPPSLVLPGPAQPTPTLPTPAPAVPGSGAGRVTPAAAAGPAIGADPVGADEAGGSGRQRLLRSLAVASSYRIGFALALAALLLPVGLLGFMLRLLWLGRGRMTPAGSLLADTPMLAADGLGLHAAGSGRPQPVALTLARSIVRPAAEPVPGSAPELAPELVPERVPGLVPELVPDLAAEPGAGLAAQPRALRRADAILRDCGWTAESSPAAADGLATIAARRGGRVVALCGAPAGRVTDEDVIERACIVRERCRADLVVLLGDPDVPAPVRELAARLGVTLTHERDLREILGGI